MRCTYRISKSLLFVFPAVCLLWIPSITAAPFLNIKVDIDPTQQFLTAKAKFSGLSSASDLALYLNKDFTISSVKTGGKEIGFTFDLNGDSPPYVDAAKPLTVMDVKENLEIVYSGYIKNVISGVNMITPDLVELAVYSGWYPFGMGIPLSGYQLELTLPSGFTLVTNGDQKESITNKGKTTYQILSNGSFSDISILASPLLKKTTEEISGLRVEMFYSENGQPLIEGKIKIMSEALKKFEKRFGKAVGMGTLRFAYSPRGGWGYSRLPIFIVSEQRALASMKKPFGKEEDIQGSVHEIAHFWWSIADVTTNDDWINEGLAEYSAFTSMSGRFGNEYREHCIKGYLNAIRKARTTNSIIETSSSSPDRYVNWYQKTALLMHVIERKIGTEKMDEFLSMLYQKFKGTRKATTSDFFTISEATLSDTAQAFMIKFLNAPGWSEEELTELAKAGSFTDTL